MVGAQRVDLCGERLAVNASEHTVSLPELTDPAARVTPQNSSRAINMAIQLIAASEGSQGIFRCSRQRN